MEESGVDTFVRFIMAFMLIGAGLVALLIEDDLVSCCICSGLAVVLLRS